MAIKYSLLRIVAAFITFFMLIPAGQGNTEEYDVKDPAECRLKFSVLSDSHIEGNNFQRYKVFARSLRNVKKNKSGHDAIVFLGDNTMNGQDGEHLLFHGAASEILRGEKILPVIGNHDLGNGGGDYDALRSRWLDYTAAFFGRELDRTYYYEVIEGYYFIVLGMESHGVSELYMTDAQYEWLEGVLDKASESGKPAFVFSHHPAHDAVDENGEYTSRLADILAEYNREHDIFSFVGHTHMPLYLFWSFHDDNGYPEIYLPRLTHLAGEKDNEIYKESGIGIEVEVYDSSVCVRGRDFYNGEWRYDTVDETVCEVTYALKENAEQ